MTRLLTRRHVLATAGAAAGASLLVPHVQQADAADTPDIPFTYCFNTSTVRGQKLSVPQQIDVTARAGYDGIEPWIRDIRAYVEGGGSLKDLRKRIDDHGLAVESAIGFAQWIVDDDDARAKGLETAKSDMELLREIGGKRIAAPPVGATNQTDLNLFKAAERYRALLELGEQTGVVPQVELWGFSKSVSRLGELVFIATECGHPAACMLPDVYHIYKGGSDFEGLRLIDGKAIQVFHVNDYPADPPRPTIADKDRVYPGDGVAPLSKILRMLRDNGSRCSLSLELFNPTYWEQDALEVARTGLEKTRDAVAKALS